MGVSYITRPFFFRVAPILAFIYWSYFLLYVVLGVTVFLFYFIVLYVTVDVHLTWFTLA